MRELMSASQVEAAPAQWLKYRRATIGASEIASIMGVQGAYSGAHAVYWNKVAGDTIRPTLDMELGLHDESLIARKFAEANPHLAIHPGGLYVSSERPWQSATYDRFATELAGGRLCPVQIKTSNTAIGYGPEGSDEIPPHYLAQVIWEMATGKFAKAYVPVLFRVPHAVIRTYVIPWDADAAQDMKAMLEAAEEFRERVRRRDPPKPDWRPSTTAALQRVFSFTDETSAPGREHFARDLRRAHARFEDADKRLKTLKNEARLLMGNSSRLVTRKGDVIAERTITKVSEYTVKAHERDTIYVKEQHNAR